MTEYHKKRPMRIDEITSGSSLTGIEPSAVATVIAVIPIADGAVRVIYQMPDGTLKERLLGRADDESIVVATPSGNPFDSEPGWGISSINFEISEFLKKAEINL